MRYFEIARPSAGYISADAADKSFGQLKRLVPNDADDKPSVPRVHDQ